MSSNTVDRSRQNRFESLPGPKRFALLTSIFVIFSLLLFILAEVAVRTRMYFLHGSFWSLDVRHLDKQTGILLPKPDYDVGPIKINSFGFRSPELESPQSDDTVRIAYLGGSTTFCTEVSNNDSTWPAITTATLQSMIPDSRLEYLNAAGIGLTTQDSLAVFKHRVAEHSPDVTFIYHSINDIVLDAYYEAVAQGVREPFNHKKERKKRLLLEASLLIELIYKNIKIATTDSSSSKKVKGRIAYDENTSDAFRQRLKLLVAAALDKSEIVVIPTFTNRLRDGLSDKQMKEAMVTHSFYVPHYDQGDLLKALNAYNDVIREFAENPGVIVVEAENEIPGSSEYFTDSVHFTDVGAKAFGEHVANKVYEHTLFKDILINSSNLGK